MGDDRVFLWLMRVFWCVLGVAIVVCLYKSWGDGVGQGLAFTLPLVALFVALPFIFGGGEGPEAKS